MVQSFSRSFDTSRDVILGIFAERYAYGTGCLLETLKIASKIPTPSSPPFLFLFSIISEPTVSIHVKNCVLGSFPRLSRLMAESKRRYDAAQTNTPKPDRVLNCNLRVMIPMLTADLDKVNDESTCNGFKRLFSSRSKLTPNRYSKV